MAAETKPEITSAMRNIIVLLQEITAEIKTGRYKLPHLPLAKILHAGTGLPIHEINAAINALCTQGLAELVERDEHSWLELTEAGWTLEILAEDTEAEDAAEEEAAQRRLEASRQKKEDKKQREEAKKEETVRRESEAADRAARWAEAERIRQERIRLAEEERTKQEQGRIAAEQRQAATESIIAKQIVQPFTGRSARKPRRGVDLPLLRYTARAIRGCYADDVSRDLQISRTNADKRLEILRANKLVSKSPGDTGKCGRKPSIYVITDRGWVTLLAFHVPDPPPPPANLKESSPPPTPWEPNERQMIALILLTFRGRRGAKPSELSRATGITQENLKKELIQPLATEKLIAGRPGRGPSWRITGDGEAAVNQRPEEIEPICVLLALDDLL